MSKKSIKAMSKQVFASVLSKEAGSKSKKTALLSKKIMLTLALGACFFAVQNPVMAEEVTITSKDMLPELADAGTNEKMSVYCIGTDTYDYYATNAGDKVIIDTDDDLSFYEGQNLVRFVGRYSESETVSSNEITLKKGRIYQLFGGDAYNRDVIGNIVNVKGGYVYSSVLGGFTSGTSGNVKENFVNVYGGEIHGSVYGGLSEFYDVVVDDVVAENVVNVDGGKIYGDVCGGLAYEQDVIGNIVNVKGGYVYSYVRGGYTYGTSCNVLKNVVNVDGGEIHKSVYGGSSEIYDIGNDVVVAENVVNVGGGKIYREVCGGWANREQDVIGNIVNVKGGTLFGSIYGGNARGTVTGNEVHISGGTIGDETPGADLSGLCIYGGMGMGRGDVSNNLVSITGGKNLGNVMGGCSVSGNAVGNTVKISGADTSIEQVIFGGFAVGYDMSGNRSSDDGSAEGIASTYNASNNTVNISSGKISGAVYGGMSTKGSVSGNTVIISGGEIKGDVLGGMSEDGDVTGNTVIISGGEIKGDVLGGMSEDGDVTGNTVNISGGTIKGFVYGGMINPDLNSALSGNTLNVKGLDIKAGNIGYFDNINFFIPSSATDGSTMLTLTGVILSDDLPGDIDRDQLLADMNNTDISNMNVKAGVVAIEGDSKLQVGDTVTLLKNEVGELITADENGKEMTYGKLTATEGVSVDYEFDILKQGDNALVATINALPEEGLKAQTKSLVETQAAGMAMLNGGMDMLAGEGIANAIAAAADASGAGSAGDGGAASDGAGSDGVSGKGAVGAAEGREFAMFGMLGASDMKYKTGSHVDLDGWNLGLGFAKTIENNAGKLTFGPVVSYGKGSYDSYLDDGVHGEGDSDYLGISLFAHQANEDGVYYEGSIGAGRVNNDYSSNDLVGAGGAKVHTSYDTDSTYVAAHLGLGKMFEVSDKAKLDVYGKYFYAHQGGDDAKLSTGETYHFDAVDSNRIRVGARYEIETGKAVESGKALNTVYVGTAYEYEFSGDAKATYKGMETASPSLQGSSGMLELGWKVKPSATSPLTIDLSANGWCGQKEGYGLKANLLWNF